MDSKVIDKVEKFFTKEFAQKLHEIAIFQDSDGTYDLFDRYQIEEVDIGYKVIIKNGIGDRVFSSLKNAVSWCVFENKNNFSKANRIEFLDKMIAGVDLSIAMHKKLIQKTKDTEVKLIYASKLSEELMRRKSMVHEITEYINESKYWQNKRFDSKDQNK